MRLCPSCNSEVSILAARCRFCSAPLPREDVKDSSVKPKQPKAPSKGKGRAWKILFFMVIAGLLLYRLVTLVMSDSHVFRPQQSTQKSEQPKSELSVPQSGSAPAAPTTPVPAADEPNFISVNGKVIPNPKKNPTPLGPPSRSAQGSAEEPNFISVNGKVIPNPRKQRSSPTVAQ